MRKNLLSMLAVAALVCGCNNDTTTSYEEDSTAEATLINVSINSEVQSSTRASYTANDDKSIFAFTWSEGDEISVIVPDTEGNANQKFTADEATNTSTLSGQIATWDGARNVCAIYPYSGDYEVSSGEIKYSATSQVIDISESNSYNNGLMVAYSDYAYASSVDNYYIPTLEFKQAMAFYQIELADIPENETILEVGLSCDSDLFASVAAIDLSTATSSATIMSNSISATISGTHSTTATMNLALLPVDLSAAAVTLYVKTSTTGDMKTYSKSFATGVNFERNSFIYNSGGSLSLTDDFEVELSSIFSLSQFSATSYPSTDNWTIIDSSAIAIDFTGLKAALAAIYSSESSRSITLEFPYLESFPDEAIYDCYNVTSISGDVATSIGQYAFYSCDRLSEITLPKVEIVGSYAFCSDSSLTTISLPAATAIGSHTFFLCSELTTVSLPAATTISNSAFWACYSLTTISLPAATTINYSAFYNCSKLTTISLPAATTIDYNAFYNCDALTTASLPAATTIGSSAFSGCGLLSDITLPAATTIGSSAFSGCYSLVDLSLPSVTSLSTTVFYGCDALSTLALATNSDAVITSMGGTMFLNNDGSTNQEKITLTIGEQNSSLVEDNTLTWSSSVVYTFKKIIVNGGSASDVSAKSENAVGIAW